MSGETWFVFGLIGVAGLLMASNKVRFDVVALMVVLALMLSGVLGVGASLAGFGSSVVILVAGLLVVGEMLARTGVARAVGDWILKHGGSNETVLLVLIMLGAALLGAAMSSTAVVAIFIPIVLRVAAETNLNSARMLLPMSYAALISGMLTLIATTPNIVVHEELKNAGYGGFGFFSFTPVGLAVLVVAVVYILVLGRRLLPAEAPDTGASRRKRSLVEVWEDFRAERVPNYVRLSADSPLAGRSIGEVELETRFGVRILGILRQEARREERIPAPGPGVVLHADDVLMLVSREQDVERLLDEFALSLHEPSDRELQRWFWEVGAAAVLIHPESGLLGKSLRETEFRSEYGLHVVGLRRGREAVGDFADVRLASADTLLLAGAWSRIRKLQQYDHDFIVLETPSEKDEVVPSYRRMPVALAILTGMVLLTLFDVVPLVAAVLLAAGAAVATRCLSMEDAYRAIHWPSLVLIAGMLPLADALEVTGGTRFIVDALLGTLGESSPYLVLSVIFFITAALGLVLSNTASAVLVAPIALYSAEALAVSPFPFAVAVVIAASSAYSTPVSTPVVTLVVEPGRYRFVDFIKVGVPLLVLTWLATLVVAPLIFPFHPS